MPNPAPVWTRTANGCRHLSRPSRTFSQSSFATSDSIFLIDSSASEENSGDDPDQATSGFQGCPCVALRDGHALRPCVESWQRSLNCRTWGSAINFKKETVLFLPRHYHFTRSDKTASLDLINIYAGWKEIVLFITPVPFHYSDMTWLLYIKSDGCPCLERGWL